MGHVAQKSACLMRHFSSECDYGAWCGLFLIADVDSFTYLSSIVSKTGDTDEDLKARTQKFLMMKNVRKSRNFRLQTKLRLFNSNVRSVQLYGLETWRTNKRSITKVQTFINKCQYQQRWIFGIQSVDKVSNVKLWTRS